MAQKDMAHNSDITSRQTNHHSRNVLIVIGIGIAVIIGLLVMLVTLQPGIQSTPISSNVETIAYNNALEMQYAQPHLDAQLVEAAPAVQFNDALAMQYAQPWLNAQSVKIAPAVQYNDALAMQYAEPWLNAASVVQFNNALEMQYAQPWLNAQQNGNCNGRLDEMYACQNKR